MIENKTPENRDVSSSCGQSLEKLPWEIEMWQESRVEEPPLLNWDAWGIPAPRVWSAAVSPEQVH